MKHFIVLFLLGCLVTSYCSAQKPGVLTGGDKNDKGGKSTPKGTSSRPAFDVIFLPTDTCNLSINEVEEGKIGKIVKATTVNKNNPTIIQLSSGNYSLLFESLETGKIIKDRSFRFTKDSVRDGKYSYPVTFK
jgi:hypothetical protein